MTQYVAAITADSSEATYKVYSGLKNTAPGVVSLALVERAEDGSIRIAEGDDLRGGSKVLDGSLIGMLVGVLAGPLGMLLGYATGGLIGAAGEADRAGDESDIVSEFAKSIPAGGSAIVAETDEPDTAALDAVVTGLGAKVERVTLESVVSDLEAQRHAAEEAAKAAKKVMWERRKQEWNDDVQSRLDELKASWDSVWAKDESDKDAPKADAPAAPAAEAPKA